MIVSLGDWRPGYMCPAQNSDKVVENLEAG